MRGLLTESLAGNGQSNKRAEVKLKEFYPDSELFLTNSCTSALEISAFMLDLQPGDEVILPSFTFTSTANAFLRFGATLVFADVDANTFNISPQSVVDLISNKTKAICIVHYSGTPATPQIFKEICAKYNLTLIEDNAHGLGGYSQGKSLGTFGSISTLSFHETKNISCAEGGAIILNDSQNFSLDELINFRDKGTNRQQFFSGETKKYTWVSLGSNFSLPNPLASLLEGELGRANLLLAKRELIWQKYDVILRDWMEKYGVRTQHINSEEKSTYHIYPLVFPNQTQRDYFIQQLAENGIQAPFHYQALHLSGLSRSYNFKYKKCQNSVDLSNNLCRLPMYYSLTEVEMDRITDVIQGLRF